MSEAKSVAIIGAGPVGLAAAAHVLERGLRPIVLEAGDNIAHSVRQWGHVQLFSPWEYNIDRAAARLLAATGGIRRTRSSIRPAPNWSSAISNRSRPRPPSPTTSARRAASPTSAAPASTSSRPRAASLRRSRSAIRTAKARRSCSADAVIDASGTWHSPNPAGANGLPAIGEAQAADQIAYGMPDVLGKDRARYAGKTVAVLGAGHSAIGTLTDLARLAARCRRHSPSGCCGAMIPPRHSAAAPTTSWSRAASLAPPSQPWSRRAGSGSRASFGVSHITPNGARLASRRRGQLLPSDRRR